MLKCVHLIEIRFYAYLYTSSFLVLCHIIFETTAQIPEVEFGGKYEYYRENTDICSVFFSYYWTCKNEHIAMKYVINHVLYILEQLKQIDQQNPMLNIGARPHNCGVRLVLGHDPTSVVLLGLFLGTTPHLWC